MAYWSRAIPTHYGSQVFRSRLEARTALGLDQLKIFWTYEPDSFLLRSGKVITPDFELKQLNIYLECKGDDRVQSDLPTIREFCAEKQTEVLVLAYDLALFVGLEGDELPFAQKCNCGKWRLQVLCNQPKCLNAPKKIFSSLEQFLQLTV